MMHRPSHIFYDDDDGDYDDDDDNYDKYDNDDNDDDYCNDDDDDDNLLKAKGQWV